jgi:hypothetical protein
MCVCVCGTGGDLNRQTLSLAGFWHRAKQKDVVPNIAIHIEHLADNLDTSQTGDVNIEQKILE